jgi:hypothetical protein
MWNRADDTGAPSLSPFCPSIWGFTRRVKPYQKCKYERDRAEGKEKVKKKVNSRASGNADRQARDGTSMQRNKDAKERTKIETIKELGGFLVPYLSTYLSPLSKPSCLSYLSRLAGRGACLVEVS